MKCKESKLISICMYLLYEHRSIVNIIIHTERKYEAC